MENFFYYSGLTLWTIIVAITTFYFSTMFYDFLSRSVVAHWFSVMWGWIKYKKLISEPIYKEVKDGMEERINNLKKKNIRKFEQKFLRKYLDNVKIKEKGENWTVFDK